MKNDRKITKTNETQIKIIEKINRKKHDALAQCKSLFFFLDPEFILSKQKFKYELICTQIYLHQSNKELAGADLDELVEWGSISAGVWGRCEPPVGPGRSPVGDQGAKPPVAPQISCLETLQIALISKLFVKVE